MKTEKLDGINFYCINFKRIVLKITVFQMHEFKSMNIETYASISVNIKCFTNCKKCVKVLT